MEGTVAWRPAIIRRDMRIIAVVRRPFYVPDGKASVQSNQPSLGMRISKPLCLSRAAQVSSLVPQTARLWGASEVEAHSTGHSRRLPVAAFPMDWKYSNQSDESPAPIVVPWVPYSCLCAVGSVGAVRTVGLQVLERWTARGMERKVRGVGTREIPWVDCE